MFWIPIWLRDNFPSFEYSRKIALRATLRKARRGKDSSPFFYLMQYNTHAPWRTTSTIQTKGYHHHFSIWIPTCVWSPSEPFFWKNPCSGCNSGIDLVVTLECAFFQLCSNVEQISFRLSRFRKSYVKRLPAVLTCPTSYTAFLLDVRCAVQSGHVPIFAAVCPQW